MVHRTEIREKLDDIRRYQRRISTIYSNKRLQPPENVRQIIERYALDKMMMPVDSLDEIFSKEDVRELDLLVAWIGLRSLLEANLLLFYTIYLNVYLAENRKLYEAAGIWTKKGAKPIPDLALYHLIRLCEELQVFNQYAETFRKIRIQGNNIHLLGSTRIADIYELEEVVVVFRDFLYEMYIRLPDWEPYE